MESRRRLFSLFHQRHKIREGPAGSAGRAEAASEKRPYAAAGKKLSRRSANHTAAHRQRRGISDHIAGPADMEKIRARAGVPGGTGADPGIDVWDSGMGGRARFGESSAENIAIWRRLAPHGSLRGCSAGERGTRGNLSLQRGESRTGVVAGGGSAKSAGEESWEPMV